LAQTSEGSIAARPSAENAVTAATFAGRHKRVHIFPGNSNVCSKACRFDVLCHSAIDRYPYRGETLTLSLYFLGFGRID
jgi:hypothetical protein